MTAFGKILVLLNLVLSMVGMTWALGLWTSRIDWTMTAPKGDQPPGKLKELRDQIAAELGAWKAPETAWRTARANLLTQEDLRRADRVWYVNELQHLRTGATAARPARRVVRDRHMPVPDPSNFNRPKMEPAVGRTGQPLLALNTYNLQSENMLKELGLALEQYEKGINEDVRLTNVLVGTPAEKGLQQRVLDERAKRNAIVLEQGQVRPLLVNVAVESELILRRHDSLQQRLEQLRQYLRKRKVDVASRPR